MGSRFWWLYDVAAICLIVLTIYGNARRGFKRNFIIILGYLFCGLLASVISVAIAQPVYDTVVRDSNVEAVSDVIHDYDAAKEITECLNSQGYGIHADKAKVNAYLSPAYSTFDQDIYRYVNRLSFSTVATPEQFREILEQNFIDTFGGQLEKAMPAYVRDSMAENIQENDTMYMQIMLQLCSGKGNNVAASEMVDLFVREPTIRVVNMFLFVTIFCFLMSLVAVAAKNMEAKMTIPVTPAANHVLGGLLGIVEALMVLWIMAIFLKMIIMTGTSSNFFSEETVQETHLLRYLYRIDFIL